MIYKLNECIYLKKNKYTFKDQLFLNNNNRLVYCFVAKKGRCVDCLLQSLFSGFTKDEKDKVISDYLSSKAKAIKLDSDFTKAKAIVKLTSFNSKKY